MRHSFIVVKYPQKELGQEMTAEESASTVLIQEADREVLRDRMVAYNFQGETVISELLEEHLAAVERLTEKAEVLGAVPEEAELPAG